MEPKEPEDLLREFLPRPDDRRGTGMIACANIGCWVPDHESWDKFRERKGVPPEERGPLKWD